MSQPDAQSSSDFTMSLPESWRHAVEERKGPAQRIAVIEDSLRCFTYGWLSCLPVIGVAWLYPAVRRFDGARRKQMPWNPARRHLAAGLALAGVGWLIGLAAWPTLVSWSLTKSTPYPSHPNDWSNDWSDTVIRIVAFGSLPALWAWGQALRVLWPWWDEPARKVARNCIITGLYLTLCYLSIPGESARRGYAMDYPPQPSIWTVASLAERDAYFPMGLTVWAGWLGAGLLLFTFHRPPRSVWMWWFGGAVWLTLRFYNW